MTNKKAQVEEKQNNQIPINVGNVEVLKVKILAEINEQLKRIAKALEK